jgi:hypothetical protein
MLKEEGQGKIVDSSSRNMLVEGMQFSSRGFVL